MAYRLKDYSFSGEAGVYVLINKVPTMTSNTTPSGVCSASSYYSACPPWNAFAPSTNGWLNNGVSLPAWLQYEFTSAVTIQKYSFRAWWADNYPSRTPTTWEMQGSNNGTSWTTLDSQTNWACPNSTDYTEFTISSPGSYKYYRMYITVNQGGISYTGIGGLRLLGY